MIMTCVSELVVTGTSCTHWRTLSDRLSITCTTHMSCTCKHFDSAHQEHVQHLSEIERQANLLVDAAKDVLVQLLHVCLGDAEQAP